MNPITEFEERVHVYPHRLVFLTPRLINEKTPRNVRMWLELIADSLDNQIDETHYDLPIFQRIIKDIERSSISPEELSEMKDEEAWELAQQRFTREGRAEGRAEGRTTREREIVLAMLTRGTDISLIAEVTGLTQPEIEQIQKEENND
jgi:predicted transposase/invertase (TIGR01784 family)